MLGRSGAEPLNSAAANFRIATKEVWTIRIIAVQYANVHRPAHLSNGDLQGRIGRSRELCSRRSSESFKCGPEARRRRQLRQAMTGTGLCRSIHYVRAVWLICCNYVDSSVCRVLTSFRGPFMALASQCTDQKVLISYHSSCCCTI